VRTSRSLAAAFAVVVALTVAGGCGATSPSRSAGPVVAVSVDGLNPTALVQLGPGRLRDPGASRSSCAGEQPVRNGNVVANLSTQLHGHLSPEHTELPAPGTGSSSQARLARSETEGAISRGRCAGSG
ncbi:MAG: hypothetical protein JWP24_1415, partial [Marmoricola sp.]|nr:hypothetical protein [Marmoricola sp.]